jgi:hypothetical protein
LRTSKLGEYSDNIFCSNPTAPNISSSPGEQKAVGDGPPAFYGLDSMAQNGFSQKILSEYSARLCFLQLSKLIQERKRKGGDKWNDMDLQ